MLSRVPASYGAAAPLALEALCPEPARSAPPPLSVETLCGAEAFERLAPCWNRVVERARIEHPFLTFEWARSFWEAFGTGAQLRIVVVREGAEVVAIAPLMLVEERVCGVRLRLLCSLANDHTPRYGFIVPGAREDAYAAIWGELAGRRAEWDALRLIQLAAGSRTLERIARAAQADGFLVGLWPSSVSPFVVPRGSFEGYLAALPRQHRGNLRTRLRRLAELGPVAREVVASGPLGPALDEGLAIEASSWKGPAGTAILGSAETRAFYAALAARAAERGWLRLEFLSVAGRRIAFDYSLRYARRHFLLKTAYDPAFARYSPYNLLCAQNLAECFEQRLLEFDFLGDGADWKERWARESRAHYWLFVLPERPLMRALHALKFSLLPRLQRIPGYLRLRDALAAAGTAVE